LVAPASHSSTPLHCWDLQACQTCGYKTRTSLWTD